MTTSQTSKIVLLFLVVAISAIFITMIGKFLMSVLLAGIFASLLQPLYRRLLKAFGGRASAASLVTLLILVLVVILPLAALLGVVTAQALKVTDSITPWVQDKIQNPDQIITWLQGQPLYDRVAPYRDEILQKAGQGLGVLSRFLVSNLSAATSGTLNFFFLFAVLLYSMYFFLIDGSRLLDRILYYLPLEEADERRLIENFGSVTRATLKGTAVIGALQGGLAGVAFAVVGIPSAVFWGALMVVLSIIPGIGTGLVWVPAAVILMAGGAWAKGIGLAIFCGAIVGSIDNFLRPRMVGQDTKLPDLLIFLSTMGGLMMFGILGFIVGPIVAALFVTVWDIYGVVFRDVLPAGRMTATEPAGEDEEEE